MTQEHCPVFPHKLIPASDIQLVTAGHWPQWDTPSGVVRALLALAQ
jgi:hypothetical protein